MEHVHLKQCWLLSAVARDIGDAPLNAPEIVGDADAQNNRTTRTEALADAGPGMSLPKSASGNRRTRPPSG